MHLSRFRSPALGVCGFRRVGGMAELSLAAKDWRLFFCREAWAALQTLCLWALEHHCPPLASSDEKGLVESWRSPNNNNDNYNLRHLLSSHHEAGTVLRVDHYIQASRQRHEVGTIIPMLSLRKQAWRVVKYVLGATHLGSKGGGGSPWAVSL